jgi:hypothetical protein
LQLAARAHRVDERNAVDRIAADVDDEQFSALLACLPGIGLVGTYVDVVPGGLGRSHQLGGESQIGAEGDEMGHGQDARRRACTCYGSL